MFVTNWASAESTATAAPHWIVPAAHARVQECQSTSEGAVMSWSKTHLQEAGGMSEPQETFRDLYERVKDEPIRINTFRIHRDPQARTEPHVVARELPAVSSPVCSVCVGKPTSDARLAHRVPERARRAAPGCGLRSCALSTIDPGGSTRHHGHMSASGPSSTSAPLPGLGGWQ